MLRSFALFILLAVSGSFNAADTTKVLFIGNSFTFYHNMPIMVKSLAEASGNPMEFNMHAPGGMSVGDVSQGNQAHMNNLTLYNFIRNTAWDVVVIQDNQGRFVLDSATFPAVSKVVEGHIKLMDSVKKYNSCAKVVLFGGWAFKNGSPPYGNTGTEMIRRILINYRVLNDTMKEVVAPIGEGWIHAINGLPLVDLWDGDQAHPSPAGSYLTASVLFSTIFGQAAKTNSYTAGLAPATAASLRTFGDSAVFYPPNYQKYNLGGIKKFNITTLGDDLLCPVQYTPVAWFKNGVYHSAGQWLNSPGNGTYQVHAVDAEGSILKSCNYLMLSTALKKTRSAEGVQVFPNPLKGETIYIATGKSPVSVSLTDMGGNDVPLQLTQAGEKYSLDLGKRLLTVAVLRIIYKDGSVSFHKILP